MHCQAPGRICVFGEHQDYLGHPVIAGAIDLYFNFQGQRRSDRQFIIRKRDLHETETFAYPENDLLPYHIKRDYFRSSLNVLKKRGCEIPFGADVEIWSQIPIGAGVSSSSVMIVAWLRFLIELYDLRDFRDPILVAEMAFQAEVLEFNEPGGKMDHYASSLGGLQFLDFRNKHYEELRQRMPGFVLVDSLEKKDTLGGLKIIKDGESAALSQIRSRYPDKPLMQIEDRELNFLPAYIRPYGLAAVKNHRLTVEGKELLNSRTFDEIKFGRLLNEQHHTFREYFKNTTAKIDGMMETALANGAIGGKMNGSGGGGSMFVYAPGKEEAVMEKLHPFNIHAYKISIV